MTNYYDSLRLNKNDKTAPLPKRDDSPLPSVTVIIYCFSEILKRKTFFLPAYPLPQVPTNPSLTYLDYTKWKTVSEIAIDFSGR